MSRAVNCIASPLLRRCISAGFTLKSFEKRFILSEAYKCENAWERRRKEAILNSVKLDEFYIALNSKFEKTGKASVIDIDLFANAVTEDHAEELEDLLHKLRLSPNTSNMLPSTPHAFIRSFLVFGMYDDLLRVLDDRLNYGIFPDDYCTGLLLDTFIKEKKYTEAAKVAVLQMLQEDWSDPIVSHLSLYACFMYLKNPGKWGAEVEAEPDDGEEIKVRVKYLRNPYFDDHFDLRDPELLVGKTLASLGKTFPDEMGYTFQLVGLGLYKKWDKAVNLLEKLLKEKPKPAIYSEGVQLFKDAYSKLAEAEDNNSKQLKQHFEQLLGELVSSNLVTNDDLQGAILCRVKSVVSVKEKDMIEQQVRTYSEWETQRVTLLQQQLKELEKLQRLEKVAEEKEKLKQREEILFFFDNEEKLELAIEKQQEVEAKRNAGKEKKKNEDEVYIPPEV